MINSNIKIGLWNARGLLKNIEELKLFLSANSVDIMLVTETHSRSGQNVYIPGYDIYHADHPSGNCRGGAAIIIKTSINHSQNEPFSRWKVQIASVSIQTNGGIVRIASLYLPPNEPWSKADFHSFGK